MQLKQRAQQGFTLIELMIVVAIIGILAAVAIPQYKNYTMKAKIGNALTSVDSVKTAIALCIQETGDKANCDAGANGVPATTSFTATREVSGITVTDGVIVATLQNIGNGIDGQTITFTPNDAAGGTAVTWTNSTNISATNFPTITDAITKNNASS